MYEKFKEDTYDNFVSNASLDLDSCVICTLEFSEKDLVTTLPCSQR